MQVQTITKLVVVFCLQVGRVRSVVDDGVKEIWLSSEDTGAYGTDVYSFFFEPSLL